jgi:hypothetical protein
MFRPSAVRHVAVDGRLLLWIGLECYWFKPAAAAKPSACCSTYKERPICFAKEQRKPTLLRKRLHPFLEVPDEDVLEYYFSDGSR